MHKRKDRKHWKLKIGKRKLRIKREVLLELLEVSDTVPDNEEFLKEKIRSDLSQRKNNSRRGNLFFSCFILSMMKACVFGVMVCCLFVLNIKNSSCSSFIMIYG